MGETKTDGPAPGEDVHTGGGQRLSLVTVVIQRMISRAVKPGAAAKETHVRPATLRFISGPGCCLCTTTLSFCLPLTQPLPPPSCVKSND